MEYFVFWLNLFYNWSLKDPIDNIGLDDGLALNRRQAIIQTNADSVHWRIYVALGEMS